MRTPQAIATEASDHLASCATTFVPPNVLKLIRLNVEFMASVAAAMTAAQTAKPTEKRKS